MKLCYIKKLENSDEAIEVGTYKVPEFIKIIIFKLKQFFNTIVYKPIDDNYCILLITKDNEKTIKRVINKLNENDIKTVAISNSLFSFKNLFNDYNIKVLNGRWLFSFFVNDIIEDLNNKSKEPISTIAILLKKPENKISNNIELIAQRAKHLNIVTDNIKDFEKLESYLYSKYGIMITVSNNKKKSLSKSDVIVNFDFAESDIRKYYIKEDATIINVNEKLNRYNKSFQGKVINDYEINLNKEYVNHFKQHNLYNSFDKNILYESMLITKSNDCFYNIRNKIKSDKIKVCEIK